MEIEIAVELVKNTPANIKILQELSVKTFIESFGALNTDANMQLYLDECLSYKKLSEEINNPNVQFYFAKYANIIIGYLKINIGEAQTELPDGNGLEVERIYVLKEYQGKKIGQYLFDKALQITKEYKLYFLWLGVWEKNIKAINFYKRNGLIEFGSHVFKLGNDEQIDILMKVNLQ